jgi:RNA polymerase sigma-70 factor (ECF subfamily)
METIDDREIIKRIKQGEIDYFSLLVNRYTGRIYNFVAERLFNKDDVDDLVQNAFFNFYKALCRFDEERPVMPYLFEIAKNEMKMYFRSRKETVSLDDTIRVYNNEELNIPKEDIEEMLNILPQQQRRALELFSEGFSYQEIAKDLGRPLNTVRTIIRRARLKMRKTYEKT